MSRCDPDEFADLKREAPARGFVHVVSGPLVRSSYHAHELADAFESASPDLLRARDQGRSLRPCHRREGILVGARPVD